MRENRFSIFQRKSECLPHHSRGLLRFLVPVDWYQKLVSVSYFLVPVFGAGNWRQRLTSVPSLLESRDTSSGEQSAIQLRRFECVFRLVAAMNYRPVKCRRLSVAR